MVPIAGPRLTWHEMTTLCATAIGRHPVLLPVPIMPLLFALRALKGLRISPINPDVIRRFSEDVDIPLGAMIKQLGVSPRDFGSGIALAVAEWRQPGIV